MFHVPEKYRITRNMVKADHAQFATDKSAGNNGAFWIWLDKNGKTFKVIACDGGGWEHVSVSLCDRCPTWKEMCSIKDLFWDEDDVVMQLHPAKSDHINVHSFCLHLWRPTETVIPMPPIAMV